MKVRLRFTFITPTDVSVASDEGIYCMLYKVNSMVGRWSGGHNVVIGFVNANAW